jgi:conjugative relaxase-like TrwC/TraI family protein
MWLFVELDRLTSNVVAALFTHDTSRALDPHLHTHCIVFNATFDPAEKRWKALQNHQMFRARKYAENVYYHELAKATIQHGATAIHYGKLGSWAGLTGGGVHSSLLIAYSGWQTVWF